MSVVLIIPARFGSQRLPGKSLLNIEGKPMIQQVYEKCHQVKGVSKVIVATDARVIANIILAIGGDVVYSEKIYANGTERCIAAYQEQCNHYDYLINVQGDEPFIHPSQIEEFCNFTINSNAAITTQIHKELDLRLLNNLNIVKASVSEKFIATSFSRRVVPTDYSTFFYRHVGIYGFKTSILQEIKLLAPTLKEEDERLEQLRWMEYGIPIHCQVTPYITKSIDTIEDYLANTKE